MATTTIAFEGPNNKPQQVDADHPLPVQASVVATAQTVGTATASAPTYSEGQDDAPLSMDLAGGLRISGTINATSATTNTAAAPSYSEGTDNAFSADLSGRLRVLASQQGSWVLSAGSALIGSVSIDQTTPGTTNAVDATNFPATVDVNSGNKSSSTLRACLATDSVAIALWGHGATGASVPANATYVGMNVGGTLTGLVGTANGLAVVCGTAANLNATVVGTGTFATQAAQSGTWNITDISGTVSLPTGAATAAKQPALGTAGSASADVITVQGIASMTALKVDGSAVTQPISAASLPSHDVTNAGTFAVQSTLQAGTAFVGYVGHGKTIKTATVNITADTDIVAAVTSKRIKVIAYALFKTGTNSNPIIFKSNGTGGTELARVLLQSQASAVFGANLSIAAPSFLFATAAGQKLTMDVGDTDTITGFITYFDDDAT